MINARFVIVIYDEYEDDVIATEFAESDNERRIIVKGWRKEIIDNEEEWKIHVYSMGDERFYKDYD